MTLQGFDYAWGFRQSLPAAVKHAGGSFVVRYVGTTGKCISTAELHALHNAGIAVGLVYETTGTTFRGGYNAGVTDGGRAAHAASLLGAPAGTPIWFAIDTDTTWASVAEYYKGVVAGSGQYKARLYGGYKVINGAPNGGHWQTYAWSGGLVSHKADLYQYHNGITVDGVSTDKCRTLNPNLANHGGWLSWAPAVVPPRPTPPVPPVQIEPPATIVYQGWVYARQSKENAA